MEVEVGTVQLPFYVIPRISGKKVTVTQIKEQYSNFWVNDTDTPISFFIEYSDRNGVKQTIEYDPSKSEDHVLYFLPPDAFYEDIKVLTLLFYWLVTDDDDPPAELEKIYTMEPLILDIKELHNSA